MGVELATQHPTDISFYAPFTRISSNGDKREVLGKATRGTPIDTYGTVITYEASKRAFERAKHIPLREMHQAKAVGRGIEWNGDDANEDIWLHSFVSRGANDTWTKVEENVLTGYSIKGINAKYGTIQRNGKSINAIVDYDLVEVSLVDNPSCPGCDITIMRADGIDQEQVASDAEVQELLQAEEVQPEPDTQTATIERAGASMSKSNRDKLHSVRDNTLQMCADNGCSDCRAMLDASAGKDNADDDDTAERIMRFMAPVYARQQAMLSEFSRAQADTATLATTLIRIAATLEGLPTSQALDEVRAEITGVKGEVERVGRMPIPQGPHTGRVATKTLATTDTTAPLQADSDTTEMMQRLQASGIQLTPQQMAQVVATNLRRM